MEAPEDVALDLALAAAFTSMSLRDRCRDPGVDTDFVLTVEAAGRDTKHGAMRMDSFDGLLGNILSA